MKIQYVDKQGVETILKLLKNKISSIVDAVVFRGTVTSVAELPALSDPDVKPGDMYTVLTESTTTADFVEGAGETIDPYIEVVVVNQGTVLNPEYKWYVLGNVFTTKDKISYGQSLPNMPYDGMLFFYMGPDVTTAGNELYSNSFYAYNESENTWDYLWTPSDKIWRGTQAEWDALSAAEKDKYEQAEIIGLDNNGVVYVVDRIEAGNMNPVTSNAVANALNDVETITPTPVTGGEAGTVTWGSFDVRKLGKLVNITINAMQHTSYVNIPGAIILATGLPKPALGRIYLTGISYGDDGNIACAYIDGNGNLGADTGFLLATSKFYGSCSYISV